MTTSRFLLALAVTVASCASAQVRGPSDPSPHRAAFVTVEAGVRLEVLDWGGSGPAVVLLAGAGNSAHVFDEFAPKMKDCCHVYGLTRRGFGASSQPSSGYDDQRLADDVLGVLDALRIPTPVLVGHSMAGQEMTTLARQHSNRVAGLIYLDAHGDPGDDPTADPTWQAAQRRLPAGFDQRLQTPFTGDPRTFAGYRAAMLARDGFTFPEWEFRNTYETNADGTRGRYKSSDIPPRIGRQQIPKDYTGIRVPVMAIFEFPRTVDDYPRPGEYVPKNDGERQAIAAFAAATKAVLDRGTAKLVRTVSDTTLVNVPGGGHYLFINREAEVLRSAKAFVARLTKPQ